MNPTEVSHFCKEVLRLLELELGIVDIPGHLPMTGQIPHYKLKPSEVAGTLVNLASTVASIQSSGAKHVARDLSNQLRHLGAGRKVGFGGGYTLSCDNEVGGLCATAQSLVSGLQLKMTVFGEQARFQTVVSLAD